MADRRLRLRCTEVHNDKLKACTEVHNDKLKACPACGKQAAELIASRPARFPFRAQCRASGWSTDAVKLATIAVKLWNEAKRKGKAKARSK